MSLLPTEVEELTASWFTEVMKREVTEARVIDRSSGTTGRARVALTGDTGLPATVFVKLAPFDESQRSLVDMTGMGVAEARFYRDLAAEVAVRVPGMWFSDTDGVRYAMVLEDLEASGCRFPSPNDDDIEARTHDIVEQLALLHAPFWESDRFAQGGDLEWQLTARVAAVEQAGGFIKQAVDVLGDSMDADFHRIADLYIAHAEDITRLMAEGAGTLVHGDSHIGNLFVDVAAGGRTGFLDWAVLCRSPGIRDVSYVLCNSVPPDVREANERALIARYCELLAVAGVALDAATAWDQHRLFAIYSWVSAAATAGMGSKWQSVETGVSATKRTTAACAHIDSVGLVESLLD